MTDREYDVALSYDGDHRPYVERVGQALVARDVTTYLDILDPARQWGEDLPVFFDQIFRLKARFAVVFVSEAYVQRDYTTLEFRSALARAITERGPYILPVRFDDVELPGLRPTIGFLDGRVMTPEQIADQVVAKLGRRTATAVPRRGPAPSASPAGAVRVPKVAPADFNRYAAAQDMLAHLTAELTARSAALKAQGYGVDTRERNGRFKLRIMRAGEDLYGLDIWIGGTWGDDTICFSVGTRIREDDSINDWAKVEWDRERSEPIAKTMGMSILRSMGQERRLSATELADELWDTICDRLEQGLS